MQIELIGTTGAGKSTLLAGMLQASHTLGIQALSGEDFVLTTVHLNRVKNYLVRTLLIDLLSFAACLRTLKQNLAFYRLVVRLIRQLPASIRWSEKLNIARNTFKKVGMYEIVRRSNPDDHLVIQDEGTLHTAHYLFVHLSAELPRADLAEFARLVPQPDVAVYLCQDEQVLIERTLARGHKRIPAGSPELVERFISRAEAAFNHLVHDPVLEKSLITVNPNRQIITHPASIHSPAYALALQVLQTGLEIVNEQH